MVTEQPTIIKPQPGPQEAFLASPADITFYGGSAGGGKSYGLLLNPLRHIRVKGFSAVFFRKETTQLTNPGGLWPESSEIYPLIGGVSRESPKLEYHFPNNVNFQFNHLQHEKTKYNYQGAQIAALLYDEVTHFSENTFFYMLSRNRSTCGIRPYVSATCNPDPDSWVRRFLDWWIDEKTGLPIRERARAIRYFLRVKGLFYWASTKVDLIREFPTFTANDIKSVSFVPASVFDNKILLEKDPGYLANLRAMTEFERERYLDGNWNSRPTAGKVFNRHWFGHAPEFPSDMQLFRFWDLAATVKKTDKDDPDFTATAIGGFKDEILYLKFDQNRLAWHEVKKWIQRESEIDKIQYARYGKVKVGVEKEPGATGKGASEDIVTLLAGIGVECVPYPPHGDKLSRALPWSGLAGIGKVVIVSSPNTPIEVILTTLHNFVGNGKGHDDIVDAGSGVYYMAIEKTFVAQAHSAS
ncbi:terminase large subunit domain-containing protein [Leptospira santarosai]|uniref:terminase large subunit domain-containing protein n=1 Tax=Leptospira santarosai TaxID=28183 RepID=UPI0026E171E4|nr:terminase family protein [Leptospira santarosai]MDO6383432.1 terminase family protein [Leptospira santarosai]